MVGRPLCSDDEAIARGFGGAACARRRQILRETLERFDAAVPRDRFHVLARQNLERWQVEAAPRAPGLRIEVRPGDWGEVTHALTIEHGTCFAVLNMANAHVPGGAYVEGAIAQEENLFRRTDCHYRIVEDEYSVELDRYRPHMTSLLSARDGRVFLDTDHPRVCIRGPEARDRVDLGYPWLADDQVFPFYELRAAAQNLGNGAAFDEEDGRRRIAAQLETLRAAGIRHAVLGAFGCGAFANPADRVAAIYRDELRARAADFSVIAFAIFAAGYGPDNFTPFARTLAAAR